MKNNSFWIRTLPYIFLSLLMTFKHKKPLAFQRVTSSDFSSFLSSVADPEPLDPYVFGPLGFVGQRCGSRSESFDYQAKVVRKTLIPTVLLLNVFLSLKNDVNVVMYLLQVISNKILSPYWRSLTKIAGAGAGSVSQRYESADPDSYQKVTDLQPCSLGTILALLDPYPLRVLECQSDLAPELLDSLYSNVLLLYDMRPYFRLKPCRSLPRLMWWSIWTYHLKPSSTGLRSKISLVELGALVYFFYFFLVY